jgi:isoleucyl-tRNA synthetase
LPFGEDEVELTADDLDIRVSGRAGFSLAQDGPHGVALDLDVTDELLAEGIAREVVRGVQDLRKSSGLAVENRIELRLSSDDATIASALEKHRDYIATEVLASSIILNRAEVPAAAADTIEVPNGLVGAALSPAG